MFHNFKVKPMFKDQYHQRHQFELTFKGDNYKGIFKNGKIQWFHPTPQRKLEKEELRNIESKVNDLMTHHLEKS